MNSLGSDEPPETRDTRREGMKEDGIGVAKVKGPIGMWRQGKRNVHGSVMCESGRRCKVVSGVQCCVTHVWSGVLGELHSESRGGGAFSRMGGGDENRARGNDRTSCVDKNEKKYLEKRVTGLP